MLTTTCRSRCTEDGQKRREDVVMGWGWCSLTRLTRMSDGFGLCTRRTPRSSFCRQNEFLAVAHEDPTFGGKTQFGGNTSFTGKLMLHDAYHNMSK
ncbi:unnamed protein product [Ectocarpus sp. 12 AP-2014]